MQIEFVNHASFIASAGPVRLICDPWLEGTSFDNGWSLLSPTAIPYERFAEITHLWFSHEHPDHFSPPCIRKIPEEHRRNISVYFQATGDRKVVDYCRKMNFKEVVEMPTGQWFELAPGIEFTCCQWPGFEDSWSCLRTPEATLLNLNDCTVNSAEEIESVQRIVGKIDVLFTQFSISAWDGNVHETERRLRGARTMLDRTVLQCNVLQPHYVVPFASFIWFCHEENHYMNEAFLPIDDVATALRTQTVAQPIIMYPGDVWDYGRAYDSEPALTKYRNDLASVPHRERVRAIPVSESALIAEARKFSDKIAHQAHRSKLRIHLARQIPKFRRQRAKGHWRARDRARAVLAALALRSEPARIYITDLKSSYLFDIFHGLTPTDLAESQCDVAMGSAALWYSFKHLWGGETLHINGRFRRILADGRGPLFHYYSLAGQQNAGRPVSWKTLPQSLLRRLGLAR